MERRRFQQPVRDKLTISAEIRSLAGHLHGQAAMMWVRVTCAPFFGFNSGPPSNWYRSRVRTDVVGVPVSRAGCRS